MIDRLSDEQYLRYSRHLLLDEFGVSEQLALADSRVLVVGAGGLGCPMAMYLASAGVGHIIINDFDQVELSNLQRQVAHTQADIGKNKADSLCESLLAINPTITVTAIRDRLELRGLIDLISSVDLVLVGTDTFSSRYLINQACVQTRTPQISAAAIGFEGQLMVLDARQADSPCYQCLYPHLLEENSCAQSGVFAPLVGVMGTMQALQALKLLTNISEVGVGQLQLFDARTASWRTMVLAKDLDCDCCSK